MPDGSLDWSDLLRIYRTARWTDDSRAEVEGIDQEMLDTLRLIDTSDHAAYESDIALLVAMDEIVVGSVISMRIGTPQWRLGTLVDDWDGLLSSPTLRIKERPAYFVKVDGTDGSRTPPTEAMLRYRAILKFVDLVGKSALFVDLSHAKIVFFNSHRIDLPVLYARSDLARLDISEIDRLDAALGGDVHAEQRFAILSEAITGLIDSQPVNERFRYLVRNVDELTRRVIEGYRLFAASFSYSKIRTEVDKGISEYIGRIHRTFSDIQGQVLGLPVASVVVATQLKIVRSCTMEAFTNVAVLSGALLFCVLLLASCANQWFTLRSIRAEIDDQKRRLKTEFKEVEGLFAPSFATLRTRIRWHRAALVAIAIVAILSGAFAYHAFKAANGVEAWRCVEAGTISP